MPNVPVDVDALPDVLAEAVEAHVDERERAESRARAYDESPFGVGYSAHEMEREKREVVGVASEDVRERQRVARARPTYRQSVRVRRSFLSSRDLKGHLARRGCWHCFVFRLDRGGINLQRTKFVACMLLVSVPSSLTTRLRLAGGALQ